jgi:hypothetical protein
MSGDGFFFANLRDVYHRSLSMEAGELREDVRRDRHGLRRVGRSIGQ